MPRPITGEGGSGRAGDAKMERLRQEVRALRHEIAGRGPPPVRPAPRGMAIAVGLGALAIGAAVVTAGLAIDLPATPGWAMVANMVPTQAAVGIVERIFTVY